MREYTIVPVTGEIDWETVPALQVDNLQWTPPVDIRMQVQICYSSRGLHVHMRAWEKDIRATYTEPLSCVCNDSCMELFFSPVEDDLRYFNMEFNPNGCTYLGIGHSMADLVRLVPQKEDELLEKRTARLEDGWELFFTVPLSYMQVFFPQVTLAKGVRMRANCFKCGDHTVQPHFITWNKVNQPTPSFHHRCDFGLMILG